MRRSRTILTLLTAGFVACGGAEPPGPGATSDSASAAAVEVTRITLGAERAAEAEGVFFAPEDELVARVETRGHAETATLIVDWKEEGGRVIGHSSRSISPDGVEVTEFHLSHPERWPEGRYEFDVWLDGRRAGTRSFTVGGGG